MKITVRKFTANDTKDWDDFVKRSNNGTLFHLRSFLSYHIQRSFLDHSLIFEKNGKIIAVFPSAFVEKDGKASLISHPGTSVGSCVVPENIAFADTLDITEKLADYAEFHKIHRIQMALPPIVYSRRVSQYMDFAYQQIGFTYIKREITSILFLENTIDGCLNKFKSTHRTAVRKAEKSGIEIRKSEDYESFYAILKNNLSIRHHVQPTHSLEELKKLKNLFPDKINLFAAFFENKMIGGVINFIINSKVALAFYISHDESYQELRPINFLFYRIFDWAIQNEFKVFDFGIFTMNEKPNMGLARFKENFGASGVFRDTIELTISSCQ